MMKIGYDAKRIVRNATGLGAYGRTLVNDMARKGGDVELRLYAPDKGRDELRSQVQEGPHVKYVYPEGLLFGFERSLWRTGAIVKDLKRDGIDIFHGLTGELPRGLRKSGVRGVVTIHDLIFMRHPEYYHWIDARLYAWKFRYTCREAQRIIAISECTKRDVMELGGVSEDKIDVIYQSCNPRYAQRPADDELHRVRLLYGLPQRFVLNVGSIEERKNVLLAVRALQRLPEEVGLVVVGKHTSYTNRVLSYIEEQGLTRRVRIIHGMGDADLQAVYHLAEAFVYPSRYEGFGIPIIEAIHSGLPVVACTGSGLEEAGGPDSLYGGPDDEEAMAAALHRVLRGAEGREGRIERSRRYVERFEGLDVASQVVDVYRRMMDGR